MRADLDLDLEPVRMAVKSAGASISARLHLPEASSSFATRLEQLTRAVAAAAGPGAALEVVTANRPSDGSLAACPALEFLLGGQPAVRYCALPEGPEGPPFVELLLDLLHRSGNQACGGKDAGLSPDTVRALARLDQSASLLVLVAPTCPRCPVAVRAAIALALASPHVTTTIVDAQQFPEVARRFSVRATPTTILDGELTVIGPTSGQALAEHILARRTPEFEDRVFRSFVETGRLSDAAARLLRHGGSATLVRAWRESSTSSRIGLLLVCDGALGRVRETLDGAVAGLLPILGSDDAAMVGDTADLLGRIGHASAGDALRALLAHPNPDVAEIAAEAIEQLRGRRLP